MDFLLFLLVRTAYCLMSELLLFFFQLFQTWDSRQYKTDLWEIKISGKQKEFLYCISFLPGESWSIIRCFIRTSSRSCCVWGFKNLSLLLLKIVSSLSSDWLLLVSIKMFYFCMLILYLPTLLIYHIFYNFALDCRGFFKYIYNHIRYR